MPDSNAPIFTKDYLESVQERDVDLLLLEEFHANPVFVKWFCECEKVGLKNVKFEGAWHSLSETGKDGYGESDLTVVVQQETPQETRIAILIENKIDAPEQERQPERYHERGQILVARKTVDRYKTVLCAPQKYLDKRPADKPMDYEVKLSYEEIAGWFSTQAGLRADWRRRILEWAIQEGKSLYIMVPSEAVTCFHRRYWEYLRENHPEIKMEYPEERAAGSSWIILKGHDFPRGVTLDHKLSKGIIGLSFKDRTWKELDAVLPRESRPENVDVVQRGTYACLEIDVPRIDVSKSFDDQAVAVEDAIRKGVNLMQYARIFEANSVRLAIK